jgi:predicted GIY-YIG superfamily endonuclease
MQKRIANEPHAVYWCYDKSGVLLYIGCTRNLELRLSEHRRTKAWWSEIVDIRSVEVATGVEACEIERQAIWNGKPLHNLQHQPIAGLATQPPPQPSRPRKGVVVVMRIPSELKALAKQQAASSNRTLTQ